jgi:hypothetical protein
MRLTDGKLEMIALNADKWDSWMLSWPDIRDFYLEVTARPGECNGLDRYGLLARAPDASQGYLFGFSCDGQYSLRIWDGKKFSVLVDWTPSEFIIKGSNQTNRLGFMAEGDRLALYANGNLLSEVQDDTYEQGAFGVFVGAVNTDDFKLEISQVAYWDIP